MGGHQVAGGDSPLNVIEVEGRWLVSTNSGWHKQYLQIYDERLHVVSARGAQRRVRGERCP